LAVPQGSFNLFNRSVMRVQGGYFFMFFITSMKAINTIANVIKYIISSVIMTYTPLQDKRKEPISRLFL